MDNSARIYGKDFVIAPLVAIRIVATFAGYADVDCEPMVSGFKVTATKDGKEPTVVNGATLEICRDKFCKAVLT